MTSETKRSVTELVKLKKHLKITAMFECSANHFSPRPALPSQWVLEVFGLLAPSISCPCMWLKANTLINTLKSKNTSTGFELEE